MLYLNDRRKRLSLSLGIFIGIITLFINIIGTNVFSLFNDIKELNTSEIVQSEKYLDHTLDTQLRIAKAIDQSWSYYSNVYNSQYTSINYLRDYIDLIVSSILDIQIRSSIVILDSDNTILYNGYMNKTYYDIYSTIESTEFDGDSLKVLNGDKDKPFGTQDRLYVVRRTLTNNDNSKFYVYIAFSEKIVYEAFFGSLDKQIINTIGVRINNILLILATFLIICIAYGWFLIFYTRSFQEKLFNSKIIKQSR